MIAAFLGSAASFIGIIFFETALTLNQYGRDLASSVSPFLLVLLPITSGVFCAWLAKSVKGTVQGLADTTLAAQHGKHLRLKDGLLSSFAALVSFSGGASVGLYGPIAHLGGLLGCFCKRILAPDIAAACGVAGAIAAVFNAPITGLIFAQEVVLRRYSLRSFTPLAISVVVGYAISAGIFSRPAFLQINDMAEIKPFTVLLFALQGLLFGIAAAIYLRMIATVSRLSVPIPLMWRLCTAGAITGVLLIFLPQIGGSGQELLFLSVNGSPDWWQTAAVLVVAKIIVTALCLGVGFAGGIVSPTLLIGALLGLLFASVIDGIPLFASVICGMMALTAPVIGAPLAAILFVLELSGGNYSVSIAATISIAISTYTVTRLGGCSYYEWQLKTRGFNINASREMMLLETQTVGDLAVTDYVSLPASATVAAARQVMLKKQTDECFVVDDNGRYIGSLRFPYVIHQTANDKDNVSIRELAQSPNEFLYADDSIATAMKKISGFSDGWVAVLEHDGTLIGGINEIITLRTYFTAVKKLRYNDT